MKATLVALNQRFHTPNKAARWLLSLRQSIIVSSSYLYLNHIVYLVLAAKFIWTIVLYPMTNRLKSCSFSSRRIIIITERDIIKQVVYRQSHINTFPYFLRQRKLPHCIRRIGHLLSFFIRSVRSIFLRIHLGQKASVQSNIKRIVLPMLVILKTDSSRMRASTWNDRLPFLYILVCIGVR